MAKDVADAGVEEELDGEAVDGEGKDAGKKRLPLRLLVIAAAAGVVVLAAGGTAAFLLLGRHGPAWTQAGQAKNANAGDTGGTQIADGPDGVVFYTPPNIMANMDTTDGKPTFLKLKLTFELPNRDTAEVINQDMPRVEDMLQTFLRELRPEDLSGSEGSYQLRMELLRRVNLIIAPAKVNTVLIEEMLIN